MNGKKKLKALLLVRDIIDIDSTYEDFEASNEEKEKIKAEASYDLMSTMRAGIIVLGP